MDLKKLIDKSNEPIELDNLEDLKQLESDVKDITPFSLKIGTVLN